MHTFKRIFENEYFVIVDKPCGYLTTPSRDPGRDSRPCMGTMLQTEMARQIYPVHRLDFEVSGLVLFAKTPKAQSAANTWFEKSLVRKTYQAWSEGEVTNLPQSFLWKNKILRGKKRAYISEHGKLAVTHATCFGRHAQKYLSWTLEPQTGRPHQLRFHMSSNGFAILGDTLYASKHTLTDSTIALRAVTLQFAEVASTEEFGLPNLLSSTSLAEYANGFNTSFESP